MSIADFKAKIGWFTIVYFVLILLFSHLYCRCYPWMLYLSLYVLFLLYISFSFLGKRILAHYNLHPFSYLLFSFGVKIILVVSFALLLLNYSTLDRKTLLLLFVTGYIIAAVFDFIILSKSSKPLSK